MAGWEEVGCLCGSDLQAGSTEAADQLSRERFRYVRCGACSLERLSPRPDIDEIGRYYGDDYAPYSGSVPFGRAERIKRLVFDLYWNRDAARPRMRLAPLLRLLLWPLRLRSVLAFEPPRIRRVFEFGAAKGTDLLEFMRAGWSVEGCDPSEQACANALKQEITLQHATAEQAVLERDAYGAILLNNVFEHLHDPMAVLGKCHRALAGDGVLVIIVPNHASLARAMFGAAWPGYDAPRHTWGWTPETITRVLARSGFRPQTISQQVTGLWLWRSVLDMRHAPGRPGALRAWLARRAPHVMLPVSLAGYALGRGDFMKVVARKEAG
ncbi:MAG: class I SAM-dependent methyltransferase [Janthinobacterium lividum]